MLRNTPGELSGGLTVGSIAGYNVRSKEIIMESNAKKAPKNKLYFYNKGYQAFESGKWIVAFGGCNSWQSKEFKRGYETAKLYSYCFNDDPNEYQKERLKAMIC